MSLLCRLITPIVLVASCGAAWAASNLPAGNTFMANVRTFGALGDGKALDTAAIQRAIDSCARKGGGTVYLPAGKYLSGPVFLKSNVTVQLEAGATLLGSTDWRSYPVMHGRWEGIELEQRAALITGENLENVAVIGRGTVDGHGEIWWGEYRKWFKRAEAYAKAGVTAAPKGEEKDFELSQQARFPRPRLINLINCRNVLLRDLTLKNSPSWTVHPVYCENVNIDGLTIENPESSPNTDGINPDSCRLVRISNCSITVGDDCITIKSGKDADGRRVGRPCEDIAITNCVMRNGHGGVVIGSEMSGGVRDVVVSNCVFIGTERGVRFKTQRGRGGVVENLSFNNIVMRGLRKEAILITQFYNGGAENAKSEPVTEGTPVFRNISVSNVRVDGAAKALVCEGLPEMPVSGLSLSNMRISSTQGASLLRATDANFDNVRIECKEGPVFSFKDARDVWVHGCRAAAGTDTFLRAEGEGSQGIRLSGNDLTAVAKAVDVVNGPQGAVVVEK